MRPVRWRVWALRALALVALAFGVATIQAGGSVLFGRGAEAAGDYVPFVVWFNFVAGFFYVAAAAGLWLRAPWGTALALALAVLTALVFAAFGLYAAAGAPFEMRTVAAMTLRTVFWVVVALTAVNLGAARAGRT